MTREMEMNMENYAGDLKKEMEEVAKLVNQDGPVVAASVTQFCGAFLSLFCC